jgi:hypothetical protein
MKDSMLKLSELFNYIGPLAAVTLLFLFIRYIYLTSFFRRLSLTYSIFSLPTDFQLNEIMGVFSITLYVLFIILAMKSQLTEDFDRNIFGKIWVSIFIFIIFIPITLVINYFIDYSGSLLLLFLSFCILVYYSDMNQDKVKHHDLKKWHEISLDVANVKLESSETDKSLSGADIAYYLFILFILILPTIVVAAYLGNLHAEELMGGNSNNCIEVKLILDESRIPLPNSTFILISYQNGNYFLIEKNKSKPKDPTAYIINDNYVKEARLKHSSKDTIN